MFRAHYWLTAVVGALLSLTLVAPADAARYGGSRGGNWSGNRGGNWNGYRGNDWGGYRGNEWNGYRGGYLGGFYGGYSPGYYGNSYYYTPSVDYSTPSYYYTPSVNYAAPSTTVVAPDATDARAHVEVQVPPNAQVFFDGAPTQQQGSDRVFVTPPLDSGRTFTYTIEARWNENGRAMDQTRSVTVSAGQTSSVDFGR